MCLGLIAAELPQSALAAWQMCAQVFTGRSPCAKLLLLSLLLFALALVLRRLLRHVSSGHALPSPCEFPGSGVKTP